MSCLCGSISSYFSFLWNFQAGADKPGPCLVSAIPFSFWCCSTPLNISLPHELLSASVSFPSIHLLPGFFFVVPRDFCSFKRSPSRALYQRETKPCCWQGYSSYPAFVFLKPLLRFPFSFPLEVVSFTPLPFIFFFSPHKSHILPLLFFSATRLPFSNAPSCPHRDGAATPLLLKRKSHPFG